MKAQNRALEHNERVAGKALDASIAASRNDQRAFVFAIDPASSSLGFEEGKRLRWDVQFINYGKSPASHVRYDIHIFIGDDVPKRVDSFFASSRIVPTALQGGFLLPPNVGNGGRDTPSFRFHSAFSDGVLTAKDLMLIQAKDGAAAVAGRVWYDDVFEISHYMDFCRATLITGAVAECSRHNETH